MERAPDRDGGQWELVEEERGVVLRLRGRLGVASEDAVRAGVGRALELKPERLVVDFAQVSMLTSPVIRQVARCHRGQLARAGTVALSGLKGSPLRAVETAGVLGYIGHWSDWGDALAAGAA